MRGINAQRKAGMREAVNSKGKTAEGKMKNKRLKLADESDRMAAVREEEEPGDGEKK